MGRVLHVGQGEMEVSRCHDTVLTTVLGSCVAACLWDPVRGVGGMNHILLPEGQENDLRRRLYGANAMELLINRLLRCGASRDRLRAKLFGGARMIAGLSDVGAKNSAFVTQFCNREAIRVEATSLGGTGARRVRFWPQTGRVRLRVMSETGYAEPPRRTVQMPSSEVELF